MQRRKNRAKDYKDSKGELYINKTMIDYDVAGASVTYDAEQDTVSYFTDWSDEKEHGTLKVYMDGKAVKIADDAHEFFAVPDGRVLYLYDYSMNYYKGELHEWDNGETRKIDDDVACMIPTSKTAGEGVEEFVALVELLV